MHHRGHAVDVEEGPPAGEHLDDEGITVAGTLECRPITNGDDGDARRREPIGEGSGGRRDDRGRGVADDRHAPTVGSEADRPVDDDGPLVRGQPGEVGEPRSALDRDVDAGAMASDLDRGRRAGRSQRGAPTCGLERLEARLPAGRAARRTGIAVGTSVGRRDTTPGVTELEHGARPDERPVRDRRVVHQHASSTRQLDHLDAVGDTTDEEVVELDRRVGDRSPTDATDDGLGLDRQARAGRRPGDDLHTQPHADEWAAPTDLRNAWRSRTWNRDDDPADLGL